MHDNHPDVHPHICNQQSSEVIILYVSRNSRPSVGAHFYHFISFIHMHLLHLCQNLCQFFARTMNRSLHAIPFSLSGPASLSCFTTSAMDCILCYRYFCKLQCQELRHFSCSICCNYDHFFSLSRAGILHSLPHLQAADFKGRWGARNLHNTIV